MENVQAYRARQSKSLAVHVADLKRIADALYHESLAADDMDDWDNRDDIQWSRDKIMEAIDTLQVRI